MPKHNRNNNSKSVTRDILLKSKLNDIVINFCVKGFILNYKSNKYMITVHHGLPLGEKAIADHELCLTDHEPLVLNDTDILINCVWNELLIIDSGNRNINLKEIKQIKYKIPSINNYIYIMYNHHNEIKLIIENYILININNLPTNPQIIYIKALFVSHTGSVSGLSGSPVFDSYNKLIGILCKQEGNYIYILPAYYIIKTLEKKNNNSIYDFQYDDPINNINNFKVTDDTIYHPSLGIVMPLNAYYLLNGDEDNEITINKTHKIKYTDITNELPISNERYFIEENNIIVVNATLLIFLKLLNPRIIVEFVDFVKNNLGEKILFSINKNIKSQNKLCKKMQYNKIKYSFTMYTESCI
jgi:hypothetical protein